MHSLGLLNDYLQESESLEARLNLEGIKAHGILKKMTDKDAFDVTVELTEIDQMGKIADLSAPKVKQRVEQAAYVKLVNVPSPYDIAGTTADPTDGALDFNMIDCNTLLVFKNFLS